MNTIENQISEFLEVFARRVKSCDKFTLELDGYIVRAYKRNTGKHRAVEFQLDIQNAGNGFDTIIVGNGSHFTVVDDAEHKLRKYYGLKPLYDYDNE